MEAPVFQLRVFRVGRSLAAQLAAQFCDRYASHLLRLADSRDGAIRPRQSGQGNLGSAQAAMIRTFDSPVRQLLGIEASKRSYIVRSLRYVLLVDGVSQLIAFTRLP